MQPNFVRAFAMPPSTLRALALSLALAGGLARADPVPPGDAGSGLNHALEQQVHELALEGTHASAPGTARVDVVVGQLDPRLHLAPCARVEPYLPDGMRLWGHARIGLRCPQGPVKWNVYLPITVRVYATALVVNNALPAGSVLASSDLAQGEVDLAEDASVALSDAQLAVGRTLTRAVKPGQSLRASHLKARQWFSAGETVNVLAQGEGFSVAGEAQALNNGVEGQPVRVRTESGRILTGIPVGERRVELTL